MHCYPVMSHHSGRRVTKLLKHSQEEGKAFCALHDKLAVASCHDYNCILVVAPPLFPRKVRLYSNWSPPTPGIVC